MTPHFVRPPHHPLPTGSRGDGIGHDATITRPPKQSTAPPGLWAPAPEVVVEKAMKPKRTLSQAGNLARQRPCGTETAAKRHRRNGEVDANGQITCPVCIAGREARRTTTRAPKTDRPVAIGERCGSKLGYDDHLARGEETCQPCRKAIAADARERYAARKAATLKPPTEHKQCGTYGGRAVHRRRNEEVCDACRMARNEYDRQRGEEVA